MPNCYSYEGMTDLARRSSSLSPMITPFLDLESLRWSSHGGPPDTGFNGEISLGNKGFQA